MQKNAIKIKDKINILIIVKRKVKGDQYGIL